jgi:hypothetical protein
LILPRKIKKSARSKYFLAVPGEKGLLHNPYSANADQGDRCFIKKGPVAIAAGPFFIKGL